MKSVEYTLRALRTLVEFDLAEAGRDLSQAVVAARTEQEQVTDSSIRCSATVWDVRRAMRRRPANLELAVALHRLYRRQCSDLDQANGRLQAAQEREAQMRDGVHARLMREKLLTRMVRRHAQADRSIRESQEHKLIEDSWLRAKRRGA